MINDRQSEDPPGTFDGVPGYVIARIDEVTFFKKVLNEKVLLLPITHFIYPVVWCAVLCCPVLSSPVLSCPLFSIPHITFLLSTFCISNLLFYLPLFFYFYSQT